MVLASGSPRRRAFLEELGLPIRTEIPPAAAEPAPADGECPALFAIRASLAKAYSLFPSPPGEEKAFFSPLPLQKEYTQSHSAHPGRTNWPFPLPILPALQHTIIAADTIVVHQETILGKPASSDDAFRMLKTLTGASHAVYTGCCIITPAGSSAFALCTKVSFWQASDSALKKYIATGEPMDKAGAYAIQGKGAFLVSAIEGSWSNVVGLPLAELLQTLLDFGVISD